MTVMPKNVTTVRKIAPLATILLCVSHVYLDYSCTKENVVPTVLRISLQVMEKTACHVRTQVVKFARLALQGFAKSARTDWCCGAEFVKIAVQQDRF